MTGFEMEMLCYDLKLEVLEQVDPKDMQELMKVNAGFRSILMREPWRILGKHVHLIEIGDDVCIKKNPHSFPVYLLSECTDSDSTPWYKSIQRESYFQLSRHSALLKRIHSCEKIKMSLEVLGCTTDALKDRPQFTFISKLSFANELELSVRSFTCFQQEWINILPPINERAQLFFEYPLSHDDSMEIFSNFVKTLLANCREILVKCPSTKIFNFFQGLSKGEAEMINLIVNVYRFDANSIDPWITVHKVITSGIPSKNRDAAIVIVGPKSWMRNFKQSLTIILTQTPEIQEVHGAEATGIYQFAVETLSRYAITKNVDISKNQSFCFKRKIDRERECVYVVDNNSQLFFAKYRKIVNV